VELKYPYSGLAGIIDTIVIPADIAIAGTEPVDESDTVLSQLLLDKCVVIQRDDIQVFDRWGRGQL